MGRALRNKRKIITPEQLRLVVWPPQLQGTSGDDEAVETSNGHPTDLPRIAAPKADRASAITPNTVDRPLALRPGWVGRTAWTRAPCSLISGLERLILCYLEHVLTCSSTVVGRWIFFSRRILVTKKTHSFETLQLAAEPRGLAMTTLVQGPGLALGSRFRIAALSRRLVG